jgi:hypothetical protein
VPHVLEPPLVGQLDGVVLAVVVEALEAPDVADLGVGHDHALEPGRRLDGRRVHDRLDRCDAQEVAHRDDADQAVALDHRDVAVAVRRQRVVGGLHADVGSDAVGHAGHPLGDLRAAGIDAGGAPTHEVALGEDADGSVAVDDHDGADAAVAHPGGGLGHGLVGEGGDHRGAHQLADGGDLRYVSFSHVNAGYAEQGMVRIAETERSRRRGPDDTAVSYRPLMTRLLSFLRSLGPAGAAANAKVLLDERRRQDLVVRAAARHVRAA